MAKELLTTLDDIKQDKDTNLIPENLREGIKTLGIEGIMVQGATKYEELPDKPSINNVTLEGNKTTADLKIDYRELLNLPTLNGIDLKGALTTTDLNLDYDDLNNTPTINNVPLTGNLSTADLNLGLSYNDLGDIPTLNGIELTGELSTGDLLISYNDTSDKPKINGKELTGDVSLADIGIKDYVLPVAGKELGGVKTTSEVADSDGYTATPIIDGIVYYKDTDTTYENATKDQSGLMSNTDKSKLDGLQNYDDSKITGRVETLETDILNKVDKEEGKGLSSEDYTKTEKDKLASLENYVLSPATQETLGGIKVGENLTIDDTGLLKAKDTTYDDATVEKSGLLSASDKEKLDGLQNYDDKEVKESITNLSNNVYKKSETYSQEEINSKLSGAYIYRGSKPSKAELPGDGNIQGDVYNLEDTGMNVAWNGEDWDDLGSIFDTTKIDKEIEDLQAKDIELDNTLKNKVDKEGDKVLSTNDYTTQEKEKLAGLKNYELPTASSLVLGGIKVGTNLDITPEGVLNATDTTYDIVSDEAPGLMSSEDKAKLDNLGNQESTLEGKVGEIETSLNNKVDKEEGKILTSNDFTNDLKDKLDSLENYELPIASALELGGIKVGDNLSIDTTGKLNAKDTTYENATEEEAGLMAAGDKAKLNKLKNYDDTDLQTRVGDLETGIENKVDKVDGKQLSTNDYTTDEKNKLAELENYDDTKLSGRVDVVETTLKNKVDVEEGKGLSTEDFTTELKTKLNGLENYKLPIASAEELGGIKIGENLTIDPDTGILDATDTTYGLATSKTDGLMSGKDKEKLDGLSNFDPSDIDTRLESVESGLENKVDKVSGKELSSNDYTTQDKEKLASLKNYELPIASQGELGGIKIGTNLTITEDGTVSSKDTTYEVATTGKDGLMSAQDKTKLEGLQNYDDKEIKASITALENGVYKKTETYSREEVDNKLVGAYVYKGSVGSKEELPQGTQKEGDVYNLEDSGMNVAWNGKDWDDLGATFDTTEIEAKIKALQTKDTEIDTVLQSKVDKDGNKVLSTNDYSDEDKEKLASLNNYDDTALSGRVTTLETNIKKKVDMEEGKGLSSNDFTDDLKNKLDELENYDLPIASNTILGGIKVGTNLSITPDGLLSSKDTTYTEATEEQPGLMSNTDKEKLDGLQNYDDSGINQKIKSVETSLENKVDKEEGKTLTTNDFTNDYKKKIDDMKEYVLPMASVEELGGIKVGDNLSIDETGILSATDTTYDLASEDSPGLMSGADKKKLDNMKEFDPTDINNRIDTLEGNLEDKVDKEPGKKLSTNDYTNAEKDKLESLKNYVLPAASETTLGGIKVGDNLQVTDEGLLSATDTTYTEATTEQSGLMSSDDKKKLNSLSNYDDTSIKGRLATVESDLENKVDKEEGKQLSTNDYTAADKAKLDKLENYVLPIASGTKLGGIKVGENLSISEDGTLSSTDTNTTYDLATTSKEGLMSSEDKSKLETLKNYDDTAVKKSIMDLEGSVYKKTDTYSRSEIDNKLVGAYIYKGSVQDRESLPAEKKQGDVYNLEDSGMNVAWNGEEWDDLGTSFDLTSIEEDIKGLKTKDTQLQTAIDSKVDKVEGKGLSSVDFTTTYETKLKGIEEGANKTTIVDNLTSTATNQALSAKQGKELKTLIDGISSGVSSYNDLTDKPSINAVELDGAETFETLGMETEYKPLYIQVTIETSAWQASGSLFRADLKSSKITANHLVNMYMNLDNQKKFTDGYTDSYAGGVYIYTSKAPTEQVVGYLEVKKTKTSTLA